MTTIRKYQSQMSKPSWFDFTTAILGENALHNADYSSAAWAVTNLVHYVMHTVLSESSASTGQQDKAFDRCQQTYFTTP